MEREDKGAMLHEVSLTTARNLSPLYDEAVRREQPVLIRRGREERGVLVARDQLLRVLASQQFRVDVIPDDEAGGFTLWVNTLNIGEHGASLGEARSALLESVRSYVRHFFAQWDFYRHLPDKAAQLPYVCRLSLAKDDAELIAMLFGPVITETDVAPVATHRTMATR